jgi:hypothetical protein
VVDYIRYTPDITNNWTSAHKECQKERPWAFARLMDSFTSSQLEGKLWLGSEIQKLDIKLLNIALLGGWYAHYITTILIDNCAAETLTNFEIDEDAHYVSFKFNRRYKDKKQFRSIRRNIMLKSLKGVENFDGYKTENQTYETVVNTSCEHMYPMWKFREMNPQLEDSLYVLQSTNQKEDCPDHINTIESSEELVDQARILDVLFQGEKVLRNGHIRFMVIGK